MKNRTSQFFLESRGPLFVLLFFCFAGAILGDSTSEALLLANFDSSVIPRMFSVNAVLLFLSSCFFIPVIDRIDRGKLFFTSIAIHSCVILIIWFSVTFGLSFLYIPLFSYAYVTKLIVFLLFWTLANDLIDSRKAASDFPVIAAGGTLGAILISFSIPFVLKLIEARTLLLVWFFLTVSTLMIFIPLRRRYKKNFSAVSDMRKFEDRSITSLIRDINRVRKEPLLCSMALLYFFIFFLILNQQFVFYDMIKVNLGKAGRIASFLGFFNGISMGLTFLLQISVTGFVLKKIGSTRSMFFLPVVLCFIFLCLFLLSAGGTGYAAGVSGIMFYAVVAGVGLRIAFFDSFFSPNFQIFFSSLPQDIRGRGKIAIEGIVKPLSIATASIWLIVVNYAGISGAVNMFVCLMVSIVLIFLTLIIKKRYSERLTYYLSGYKKKRVDTFNGLDRFSNEKQVLNVLTELLENESDVIKEYIVDILTGIGSRDSVDILKEYYPKSDKRLKVKIIAAYGTIKRNEFLPCLKEGLGGDDPGIVSAALSAISKYEDIELKDSVYPFVNHVDPLVRKSALTAMWRDSTKLRKKELQKIILSMLFSRGCDEYEKALEVIGGIKGTVCFQSGLERFFQKHEKRIYNTPVLCRKFISACSSSLCQGSIEILLCVSGRVKKREKDFISKAFSEMIQRGFGLSEYFRYLVQRGYHERNLLLRGLLYSGSRLDDGMSSKIKELAEREMEEIERDRLNIKGLVLSSDSGQYDILIDAVMEEAVNLSIDSLILICALLDSSGHIVDVMNRLNHKNMHVRGRAFEVLDNEGDVKLNRKVIALLEANDDLLQRPGSKPGGKTLNTEEIIDNYINSRSFWLRSCAMFCRANSGYLQRGKTAEKF